jgi:hypothetical protein
MSNPVIPEARNPGVAGGEVRAFHAERASNPGIARVGIVPTAIGLLIFSETLCSLTALKHRAELGMLSCPAYRRSKDRRASKRSERLGRIYPRKDSDPDPQE